MRNLLWLCVFLVGCAGSHRPPGYADHSIEEWLLIERYDHAVEDMKEAGLYEPVEEKSTRPTPVTDEHVCPTCKDSGDKSTVHCVSGSMTLMLCPSWWDENGNYHYEPCNLYSEDCTCSNEHRFSYQKMQ